jgi:hypothetical protein
MAIWNSVLRIFNKHRLRISTACHWTASRTLLILVNIRLWIILVEVCLIFKFLRDNPVSFNRSFFLFFIDKRFQLFFTLALVAGLLNLTIGVFSGCFWIYIFFIWRGGRQQHYVVMDSLGGGAGALATKSHLTLQVLAAALTFWLFWERITLFLWLIR